MCQSLDRTCLGRFRSAPLLFFVLVGLWVALHVTPAWAHKVTIFAYVEGDTVFTQSKFSGGKRAKNATVLVYDKEGNQLLEGATDENGEFSFKVPKKTDLKIVLKASMGHRGEWTIPEEEITGVADTSGTGAAENEAATAMHEEPSVAVTKADAESPATAVALGLSREEFEQLVDKALDRKLAPILTMLTDSLDRGPKMSDVIGGIGYIFGLVGVGLYFSTRRKRG